MCLLKPPNENDIGGDLELRSKIPADRSGWGKREWENEALMPTRLYRRVDIFINAGLKKTSPSQPTPPGAYL